MTMKAGGGEQGGFLHKGCVPNTALQALLDARITAGTSVTGLGVSFTFAANNEISATGTLGTPDGMIISYNQHTNRATVQVYNYNNMATLGRLHTPSGIQTFSYAGTVALGYPVVVVSTLSGTVTTIPTTGTRTGKGAIISIDTANNTVDVLI